MREIYCGRCKSETIEHWCRLDDDGAMCCPICLAFRAPDGTDIRISVGAKLDNIIRCAGLVSAEDTSGIAETLQVALGVQLDRITENVSVLPDRGSEILRADLDKARKAVRQLGERPLHHSKISGGFAVREDKHDAVAVTVVRARGYDVDPRVKIDIVGLHTLVPARLLEGSSQPYRELLTIAKDAEARMRDVVETLEGK